MKILISLIVLIFSIYFSFWTSSDNRTKSLDEQFVTEVLRSLGDTSQKNRVERSENVSAKKGEELLTLSYTYNAKGRKTRRQSKYFNCIACHNLEREDPDLTISDPQLRLQYVANKGIPLLPATTFYGIVNRETYYNDDYEIKYPEWALTARHDLRYSIQLCATECSQGRAMEDWEIESVMAYFETLGYKMEDLALSNTEKERITQALDNKEINQELIEIIKSKYLLGSPAHNTKPIVDQNARYAMSGDAVNGQLVYELSCQHCHYDNLYSFRVLDNSMATFKRLHKNLKNYNKSSVFEVTRWGTESIAGKKAYMPYFTKERLSDQQIMDVATYIDFQLQK